MKSSLVKSSVFLIASLVVVTTQAIVPKMTDLASTMKAIGERVKTISAGAGDTSQYQTFAGLADEVAQLLVQAKSFTPDTISKLPETDQPAKLQAYQALLDQTSQAAQTLANDLRAGDSDKVNTDLAALANNKKDGHDQFKGN